MTYGAAESKAAEHEPPASGTPARGTVVLVPVKSFDLAKGRLSDRLDVAERGRLAQHMAAGVLAAARPLPTYVVCDDESVARWADDQAVGVLRVNAAGLNEAVTEAVSMAAGLGYNRAIISHADLPLARDLTWLDRHQPGHGQGASDDRTVIVVTDHRGQGTNVMVLPLQLDPPFVFRYGPDSARQHQAEAGRLGLAFELLEDERLGWDLDTPEDLAAWLTNSPEFVDHQPKGTR